MKKLDERGANNTNVLLQMMRQMYPSQQPGQVIAPTSMTDQQHQQPQIQYQQHQQ